MPIDLGDLCHCPLTRLTLWSNPLVRLSHANIVKLSSLSALKNLELEGWKEWESSSPLTAISLLEIMCCSCRFMLIDFVNSGPWDSLRAIILAERKTPPLYNEKFFQRWLKDRGMDPETVLLRLAEGVLHLPLLESIRYRLSLYPVDVYWGFKEELDQSETVSKIASINADQWRLVEGQTGLLMYHRIRE